MEKFFSPDSVAVIGASRTKGKVGYELLENIVQSGFKGEIFPVNPKATEIQGYKCYPNVSALPNGIDLALISLPAKLVPNVLKDIGKKGIKAVIIISAGFREIGGEGVELENKVARIASEYDIRLIGPNCLGIINTHHPINASFATQLPKKCNIGFISQSGALCTAVLDRARAEGIGFSKVISIGNEVDLCETDFLETFKEDSHTDVIIGYLESIRDGQRFMQIARKLSFKKPIVLIKSGGTDAGSKAASSHTGSLTGSNQAYETSFKQSKIIRAESIEDLFNLGVAFAYQPLPEGKRVAVITNAGGPGILTADACEREGLNLTTPEKSTIGFLRENLPAASNFYNPIDLLGDAKAGRYKLATEALLKDQNINSLIVLLTPQAMTEIKETAEVVSQVSQKYTKPVIACFMGGGRIEAGIKVLKKNKVPAFPSPEKAAHVLSTMLQRKEMLNQPSSETKEYKANKSKVEKILTSCLSQNRVNLTEIEAMEVISAYGVQVPKSQLAKTVDEATKAASNIGYPVAMKIVSPDIAHKSDSGGVRLKITDASGVRDAFDLINLRTERYMPEAKILGVLVQEMVSTDKEIILGMTRDPQFGPLIMFGLGGVYVEILKDVSFRIAPITQYDATEMLKEIKSYPILAGARGERPADIDSVVEVLLRISQLVTDFPQIMELEINPLKVGEPGEGSIAVDVRLTIGGEKE